MNIRNVKIGNDRIRKIIDFLNDDKHIKTEEVFTSRELYEKFDFYANGNYLLIELKKHVLKENMYVKELKNDRRYIFGHPKLIKILKENL